MRIRVLCFAISIATVMQFLVGSAATAASSPGQSGHLVSPGTHLRAGAMPMVRPATSRVATRALAPAGAHLNYFGGHVISNVKVIQVLYGSGSYEAEVTNTAAPSIASFYAGITNSSYYDWLREYNTNITAFGGGQGTNQVIGHGTFGGQIQITPSAANNGATIDDTMIQPELQAQINAGHLPVPDANTLFAVYFPDGKVITMGGSSSGVQFCAYHGTVAASGSLPEFYYSILPGFGSPGFTSGGCGAGTEFQNVTSVSSHELVEATTDAEVGLATVFAPPLAWYDPQGSNGEIGDICNGQQQAITGSDGRTYTVQQEWSNAQNNCVVSGPAVVNDFSISANPASVNVTQGSSGMSTISTAITGGSAQSVTFSASGLPTGASASFSPSTITSGGSSTLTITASSSTPAGSSTLTVTGTGTANTHATTISLTVTAVSGGGGITNGAFETGTLAGWTSAGTAGVVSSGAQAGTYAARVGGTAPTNGDSSIAQTFTAPSGANRLQFYYDVFCPDTLTYDWATATLKDNTTNTTATVLPKTCVNGSGWRLVSAGITAGHSYTLTLLSHDDNYPGDPTYTLYDSVSAGAVTNDFSIAASPSTVSATQGGGASTTINTALTSGSAQSISLSASGLPTGATASFNPASVNSGAGSTLTLNTASTTPTGTFTVTVTGIGASATHVTTVSLTVNAAGTGPAVTNGGFETGTFAGWTTAGASETITTTSHSGSFAAWLGSTNPTNGDSTIRQTVFIPSTATTLSFWYAISCPDTVTYDWFTMQIRTTGGTTLATPQARTCPSVYQWTHVTYNVASLRGQTVQLWFSSHDDNYPGDPTYSLVDDVTIS